VSACESVSPNGAAAQLSVLDAVPGGACAARRERACALPCRPHAAVIPRRMRRGRNRTCTVPNQGPHAGLTKRYATVSHMDIGVRDLRNQTGRVIDAVRAGERVTLTVHGEPVADIVPHGRRARWLSGPDLRNQLADRAADPALQRELDELAGQTLESL
jgi:prevent-host-death family protein